MLNNDYLETLRERAKESRAHKKFQFIGVEIAKILDDPKHTALYIKLAKERGEERLMRLAKEVGERKNIKNKGAYFMRILTKDAPKPSKNINAKK